jgi:hypothetical protein
MGLMHWCGLEMLIFTYQFGATLVGVFPKKIATDDNSMHWAVTKFMLGANIALPGALVCISRQLELISSSKTIPSDSRVIRNRTILEFLLCYVVPIIYMLLRECRVLTTYFTFLDANHGHG